MSAELDLVRAVVQAGTRETPYVRCGRGPAATLLLAVDEAELMWLLRRFAAHARVVAPLVPLDDPSWPAEAAEWLRGVADGLGLERPRVVLAPSLASLAGILAGPGAFGDVIIAADEDAGDPLPAPVILPG